MHKRFDHQHIEEKWHARWREDGLYDVGERDTDKEKEYVLIEWPYPSGNLHIGHWYAFAVPDIYVRTRRMQGKQVLFPIGFDAFGLPAENAAIKRNLDPKEWTDANVAHMKGQLESMGNAFSWDKTTSSTDPDYYRWTQWMFTKFFEKDIAYRGKGTVNWCPSCNTVLANEQVTSDDTCERCGSVVEKRQMDEWKLRITDYADRLVDDLDALAWPESIKESQRNWIGRSRGARLPFTLSTGATVEVFTTRADTLAGATFLALAPEHPLIGELLATVQNVESIREYVATAAKKDERERTDATKEKTGIELMGVHATNLLSGAEMKVFIADYVLGGYGTGALMGVPAHDERDFAFAEKFDIAVKAVVLPAYTLDDRGRDARLIHEEREEMLLKGEAVHADTGSLTNSGEFDGLLSEVAIPKIVEKVGGRLENTYRLRDWSIGRQRYWGVPIPIVYDPEGKAHAIPEEHLPWHLPTDVDFRPTGEPPLAKSKELKERVERIFGKGWTPEVETMDTFVDSSWYFLRYIDNQNNTELSSKRAQEAWMPVDLYFGGAEHTTMHLLYSRFWQKALFDLGLVTESEPYRKRINRGLVLGPDGNKMSKSKGNVIDPDEQVARLGADTVKMYLAFMGPYGEVVNYPWDMGGIAGIRRFLERVNGLADHLVESESDEVTRALYRTIAKVSGDIEAFKFNTAISALMIYLNGVEKEGLSRESYRTFLRLLAPFAPHLADELWEALGEKTSIHTESWPEADSALARESSVSIGVQVDGKVRGTIELAPDADEAEARRVAEEAVAERLSGREVVRFVYVPGRIVSIVTKESTPAT